MSLPVTDEDLVAFLDGELSDAEAQRVEAAINADPALAARAEMLAEQDDLIRRAFDPLLHAPVPAAMVAAVTPQPASASVSSLVDARALRAERQARTSRWGWPQLGAMAASLVIGLMIGPALLDGEANQAGGPALVMASADGVSVPLELASMLDTAASGEAVMLAGLGEAQVDITFRNLDADVCRQVQIAGAADVTDLVACRNASRWQVAALGTRVAPSGEMRMASGEASPAVLAAVDAMIDSDPLVGEDESAALGE